MRKHVFWGILGILFTGMAAGCAGQTRKEAENSSCTKHLFAMDTYMDFTAYGENGEKAVDEAIKEVKRLDALLSTGSASSEVSELNACGTMEISEDTAAIFRESLEMYERTDGLFDFTIYPLMKLWGFPRQNYHVATDEELERVLPLVDASKVQLKEQDNGTALVTLGEGQEVDFGGIAKGYTSASVMEIFKKNGVSSGIVSLGGNVQVLNKKTDGTDWNVGIRAPQAGESGHIAVVSVDNKAVVTSGGYERFFEENGKTYIHILDPRTGYPAESDLVSVTVISEDGMLADALSTSLYLMGKEEAGRYWKSHDEEFDMVLLGTDGKFFITDGIKDHFQSEIATEILETE